MPDMTRDPVQENETIIGLLQQAVNAETASRNLYWARSMYWRNIGFKPLARYYLDQSGEDHAERSARRLLFLGGSLSMVPTAIESFMDKTLREQFSKDLEIEVALSEFYSGSIETLQSNDDHVTEDIWRKVLASTQKHIAWLQKQIVQMDLVGDENYLQTWI